MHKNEILCLQFSGGPDNESRRLCALEILSQTENYDQCFFSVTINFRVNGEMEVRCTSLNLSVIHQRMRNKDIITFI